MSYGRRQVLSNKDEGYKRTFFAWRDLDRDIQGMPQSWGHFRNFAMDVGAQPFFDSGGVVGEEIHGDYDFLCTYPWKGGPILGTLRRKDPSKPHGAGNSFWADPRVDTGNGA